MKRKLAIAALSGAAAISSLAGLNAAGASANSETSSRAPGIEQGQARKAARFAQLTDEQRTCLQNAGLARPEGRPTLEQRQALRAAATDCGIEIPTSRPAGTGRPAGLGQPATREQGQARTQTIFSALTDDQRDCLTDAGLARPDSRPTVEQRQELRRGATDCGIDVPGRPAGAGFRGARP
jgi:hypothetical protein